MIPKTVKIGNMEYTIEMVGHPLAVEHREVGGLIDYINGIIKIRNDGFSDDYQAETWWHEVMHAIFRNMDITFDDEEMVCRRTCRALHALMKDNPGRLPGQKSESPVSNGTSEQHEAI